jgi:hypothetical protein
MSHALSDSHRRQSAELTRQWALRNMPDHRLDGDRFRAQREFAAMAAQICLAAWLIGGAVAASYVTRGPAVPTGHPAPAALAPVSAQAPTNRRAEAPESRGRALTSQADGHAWPPARLRTGSGR